MGEEEAGRERNFLGINREKQKKKTQSQKDTGDACDKKGSTVEKNHTRRRLFLDLGQCLKPGIMLILHNEQVTLDQLKCLVMTNLEGRME